MIREGAHVAADYALGRSNHALHTGDATGAIDGVVSN